MSAIRQVRVREQEEIPAPGPEPLAAAPARERDNPLELLRDAIARLKSSEGGVPDQAQVASLLAEARDALERAGVIARAVAECDHLLDEARFDEAFHALDEGLAVYPEDPLLLARRRAVESRRAAHESAAAVGEALREADWLFEQDRVDLAVQFLREKAAGLPLAEPVASRLAELEDLLPAWERKRYVQSAQARAATLERLQQWQAALTLLEEGLLAYPGDEELAGAASRVREALAAHERRKKLARRIELIEQRIAAQAWRQALALLESTQSEFPGEAGLDLLRSEVDAGLRRSECESVVAEVRQHLADGELSQAEFVLRRGRKSLGADPALDALREELVAEKKYRDDLRMAQILFGRRQLPEAERALAPLAATGRAEARALLEAVRGARAAAEEENFCERGREKALALIQEEQYAQAVDLLRNLLSLFPGSPLLERDLMAAQAGLEPKAADPVPAAECPPHPQPVPPPEPEMAPVAGTPAREIAPPRFRRAAIAGTAFLVLVSVAGAAWKLSRQSAPVSRPPVPPPPAPAQAAPPQPAPPLPRPQAAQTNLAPAAVPSKTGAKPESQPQRPAALRRFQAPDPRQPAAQPQGAALPLPPGAEPVISAEAIPGLPIADVKPSQAPAPPPAAGATLPAGAARPAPPPADSFQEAQLVSRTLPVYPALARQRALYGVVRLEAIIDQHGDVKNVKAVAGDPVLAVTAKNAVAHWKYKPATLNGKPVATSVSIQILFGDRNK